MSFPKHGVVPASAVGLVIMTLSLLMTEGQAIYDEAQVPGYTLPDPLLMADGSAVKTAEDWRGRGRPEVLRMFEEEVYGRSPGRPAEMSYRVHSLDSGALGGKATRKEVTLTLGNNGRELRLNLLLFVPNGRAGAVPAFLGMNFKGNHTIHPDPGISLFEQETKEGMVKPAEETRGQNAGRWGVERIIGRGYALATLYYGDVDPDFHDGFKNGVHPLFLKEGQMEPAADEWGSIGGWAWGLSRVMDYLGLDDSIDARRVALLGHSRLGKTSLWAGAQDERFAVVISNDSGCGGAALSRRRFGESVKRINTSFPHWFCGNYKKFNDNEGASSVDQHMLIALVAPRPVYVASAEEDRWADPRGEFLSAKHAEPVYALFGKKGLGVKEMPEVNTPVGDVIGYHIRTGKHDVTAYDWDRYLDFADRHLAR